jgi:hypothetical protein
MHAGLKLVHESAGVLRGAMPRARLLLCLVYGATAVLALVATWSQNVAYLHPGEGPFTGFIMATLRFWPDTLTTPAGVSITVDLAIFFFAAAVLMVYEARRLGIPGVWLYVALGFLVAISVTFPLFLIARERRLAQIETGVPALAADDRIALAAFRLATAGVAVWTLGR